MAKKLQIIPILGLILTLCLTSCFSPSKPMYMWFDCEANYGRLSHPDSIDYYLTKVHELGFTDVVIDMKSIMGEVLYKSDIAPYMGEWDGVTRSEDYDMFQYFLDKGEELSLNVHASLNVFAGGHNFHNRGIIYGEHADWQSIAYVNGELMPISEMKTNYNGMLNPANPDVQKYQLDILKEFIIKYPETDGLILDRVRFDNVTSDFSPLSKEIFETYSGVELTNYPDDVLYWTKSEDGEYKWNDGVHFNKWIEWRASVIKSFITDVHSELKAINPDLILGDYTGAWYPTYYQLGVNWASSKYDPSKEFEWATPEYKNMGYAELLDVYMTGLYYTLVTKADVDKSTGVEGKRTEAGMDNSRSYWYCVEGGAELVRELTCGAAPVIGSIYVDQYEDDQETFQRATAQALKSTNGLMIFDIVHIIDRNWWDVLERATKQ